MSRTVALLFVASFLISGIFSYSLQLEKRKGRPVNWFEALLSCLTGEDPSNMPKSYGCYCGTAIDRQFIKNPVDDLDKCCQEHKTCLKEYTTEGGAQDSYCSSVFLIECKSKAIECIKKQNVKAILKKKRIC